MFDFRHFFLSRFSPFRLLLFFAAFFTMPPPISIFSFLIADAFDDYAFHMLPPCRR